MRSAPGYPLPEGDCYTEELCPIVVCVPNKDAYFQALWGTLTYLATWIAWERDDDKRGKDAAASWKFANDAMEIGDRMGCLQDLQDDVSNILLFLQNKKDCCDPVITFGPSTEVETEIDPGVGDPPDYYGETAITDWDDWAEHVCYNAHLWVDELVRQAGTIEVGLSAGAIAVGLLAASIALIAFLGTGGLLSMPFLMLAAAALASGGAAASFDQAATDLEAARDDIVCALIWGHDIAQAIEDALTIGSTWTLYYSLIDYDTASSIIYEGGQGTEYLPSETRDDCDCGLPEGYNWVEADDIQFTLSPDTFGRLNSAVVTLPEIKVGYKVATSASWGCMAYPAGAETVNVKNTTYQSLAVRYTYIANTGNSHPYYDYTCRANSPGDRHIWFYTLDVAEGIDAAWAVANSESYRVEAGGHAKRPINYSWPLGMTWVGDTVPGATPVYFTVKIEHLIWVP